ncbi:MAG TPA: BMP family ABC transporter substrate-binding protein, partial [Anaerolineales bacterium]|nr:BMP family ABC transporter substrate-binding protein [Anaerolineales bacterium]
MSKKLFTLMAVLTMAAMLLAACAPQAATTEAPPPPTEAPVVTEAPVATEAPVMTEAPTEAPVMTEAPTEAPVAFKACQVTDTGGIDDKSFNATAWKGAQDAMEQLGVEAKFLESQQQTDYEKNINAFIEEGCNIIVTVGFLLGDATKAAAEANPD